MLNTAEREAGSSAAVCGKDNKIIGVGVIAIIEIVESRRRKHADYSVRESDFTTRAIVITTTTGV